MDGYIDSAMLVFIISNQLMLYYKIGRIEERLEKIKEVIVYGGDKEKP